MSAQRQGAAWSIWHGAIYQTGSRVYGQGPQVKERVMVRTENDHVTLAIAPLVLGA